MSKLIITADLGTFKAYLMEKDPLSSSPRLELVDAYETPLGDDRIGRRLSDSAGQTNRGAVGNVGGETGERHNIHLENERRSVKMIAGRIALLLKNNEYDGALFAASNEINPAVMKELTPEVRKKISRVIGVNLTNAPRETILNHCEVKGTPAAAQV